MKKVTTFLFVLFFGMAFNSMAQSAPKDFFAGKWEILVMGTPSGDSKMITELVRKDGKLTGELKNPTDTTKPAIPITSVQEGNGEIEIAFTSSGYDITLSFKKVDDDNLEGQMMGMFDAKAKRIK